MNTAVAQIKNKPHFSIPSIIALGAAIASFFVRPATGVLLAVIAIICGVIGMLLAMAPSVRGGLISILSLLIAAIGIAVAIIKETL